MKRDAIIIGAGPAGLSSAISLAEMGLSISLIEKLSMASLEEPTPDGR